jgi:hypothetical protein
VWTSWISECMDLKWRVRNCESVRLVGLCQEQISRALAGGSEVKRQGKLNETRNSSSTDSRSDYGGMFPLQPHPLRPNFIRHRFRRVHKVASTCPSVWINWLPSGRFSWNMILEAYSNLSRKFGFLFSWDPIPHMVRYSGFGGLEVAFWPLIPKFAGF